MKKNPKLFLSEDKMKVNKFLIRVFGKKPTEFSIISKKDQSRKELINEVDNIVGHRNYSAENYLNYFSQSCFGWRT
jgi:hypothetical protein